LCFSLYLHYQYIKQSTIYLSFHFKLIVSEWVVYYCVTNKKTWHINTINPLSKTKFKGKNIKIKECNNDCCIKLLINNTHDCCPSNNILIEWKEFKSTLF
jgi:hypothetical protein